MPSPAACVLLAGGAAAAQLHGHYRAAGATQAAAPFHFTESATVPHRHAHYGTVQKSTFHSPPISLSNGEAWFTLPTVNKMPFPKPGVPFAIVRTTFDLVDSTGRRPPVSEVYPHHWLVYDKLVGGSGDNVDCGHEDTFVSNIFGAGAEMRGMNYDFPKGYAYMSTEGQDYFSANIHIINTVDLSTEHFQGEPDPAGAANKACVECNWSPGNTGVACIPRTMGNFGCCVDLGRCLVNNMANRTKTTYYLTYDVYWTTEITDMKPLQYGVFDTWPCDSLGNLKPNEHTKVDSHGSQHNCDDTLCNSTVETVMDKNGTLIWAYGHQHVSAINASLFVNGERVCTSKPHYGTDPANPVGNEKGFVTSFDLCLNADGIGGAASNKTVHVKAGDVMKVESLYSVAAVDPRILPMPGGAHGGVMGLMYFWLSPDGGWTCRKGGECVAVSTTEAGVDLKTCQAQCHIAPPAPPAGALYACKNDTCVAAGSGVSIATCKAACG